MGLSIDPLLKADQLAPAFRRFGRIHIPDFLDAQAALVLRDLLMRETQWMCSTTGGGRSADIPVEMLEGLPASEQGRFIALAHAEARNGFHYMFDNIRISDPIDAGGGAPESYRSVLNFLNSPEFLDFIRTVTGDERATCCDAQATRFQPGHYLTQHDDQVPHKSRLYAYVLNLSDGWRSDWGGVLNFLDEDGHVAEGYSPVFNALNLFKVPQRHAVSFVTPFAGSARLSITGWVRDDRAAYSSSD